MLVLSRHRDESIRIGDDITVTIVDVRGDRVRIGINAPSHIAVHRQEVYDNIQKEMYGNGRSVDMDTDVGASTVTTVKPPLARLHRRV